MVLFLCIIFLFFMFCYIIDSGRIDKDEIRERIKKTIKEKRRM